MASDDKPTFGGLRRQAEAILKGQPPDLEGFTREHTERLVHELQVHQIELELQNEALRQTQQALELARDEYAELYDRAPVGYLTVDGGGAIARANATAAALLGVEQNALLGQPFRRFVAHDEQDAYHFFLVRLLERGARETVELGLERGDGTEFRGRVEGRVGSADRRGRPSWWAAVSDVTAEAQAREDLRQARDELELRVLELSALQDFTHQVASTLEVQPLLDLMADRFSSLLKCDSLVIYGVEQDRLSVLQYRGPLPPEIALQARFALDEMPGMQAVIRGHEPLLINDVKASSLEALAWRREIGPRQEAFIGDIRSWLGVPLRVKERVVGILRLAHGTPDFFTPRHARLALAFADQAAVAMENAQLYAQARTLAVTQERERLARDLHDAISQTLFSASLIADVLPRLWSVSPEKALDSLRELGELTRGAQAEMRTLLWELRPDALLQTSLGDLLRQLGVAVSAKARVEVTLEVTGEHALPPDVHVGLYRIAQEAFNNIRKHAKASAVAVSLSLRGGQDGEAGVVDLSIRDDGCGFDLETASHRGLGVGNIRQRAAAIGASLYITSQHGCGTQVRVVWPEE